MAAVSEYLLANAGFKTCKKHSASFCKLLFNANFRSIYTWDKDDITNPRENFNYDAIINLPLEIQTWIRQERVKHARYFAVEWATCSKKKKAVAYDPVVWMARFRHMFTESTSHLHKKQIWVRKSDTKILIF